MIITVTMNPAIDKTVEIDKLIPGGLNRIRKVMYDAGGKGINVSKTIRALGGESIATGFSGGSAGRTIEAVLKEKGIKHDFVRVDGETRTNTKVLEENGEVTELNEPGPQISQKQMEELIKKLEGYAGKGTLFIFSGSIPGGANQQVYAQMIRLVHKKGAEALLDAEGEVFRQALLEKPDIIKPNRMELEEYAGGNSLSGEALLTLVRDLKKKGIKKTAVSMGKDGALFSFGDYEAVSPALHVRPHSTVGAGDAMVAALAYAWNENLGSDETVRLCMAASAGAVATMGTKPPDGTLVDALMGQVIIERI